MSSSSRADLKRRWKLKTPEEALRILGRSFPSKPPRTETIPLSKGVGRVLSEDVLSPLDVPHYSRTFVDGYALRSRETSTASPKRPLSFKIAGRLFPSDYPTVKDLPQSQAVYVACGAPLPAGADAVVGVEETELGEDQIILRNPAEVGEGIIPRGDDVRKGERILKKGEILRPQDIGLLSGLGIEEIRVVAKPVVGVISMGDELVESLEKDGSKFVNNYATILAGFIRELGATPRLMGIAPDQLDAIKAKIEEALAVSDIVATIGGCSVGVKDLVPDAINALGKPGVILHGVAVKPGHVVGFGALQNKPVTMLPGHIVSTLVGFHLFIAPLIAREMGGLGGNRLPRIEARLADDVRAQPIHTFQRVALKGVDGGFLAETIHGGSNTLHTLINANAFFLHPPGKALKKGARVEVTLFSPLEYPRINSP